MFSAIPVLILLMLFQLRSLENKAAGTSCHQTQRIGSPQKNPSDRDPKSYSLQYGRVGADITINCNTTLSNVEWQINGEIIQKNENMYTNGTQLTLLHVNRDQEGIYSCHLPHTKHIVMQTYLQLGYPPEKLQVQCWAMSYPEKLKCTWDLKPDTLLHTTFISTYRLGLESHEPSCRCVQFRQDPYSCLISEFQLFTDVPYLLNVTATNPLGSITQVFPFIVEDIIRPDPPENVTLSSVVGEKTKLLLCWSPPHSWPYPDHFPLMYMIRYKRVNAKTYRMIGPYGFTCFILVGIRPRGTVQAQVAAKDFTDYGEYSNWSVAAIGQPWS
ncbi:interleukin-27 subunit beta isoform X2 [Spea bombifrons]|uniref:interleukin-27 subunit beta isoform X2 n=1 Tax=Spea bombifrons TaxID=233779 RepID=UPI00234B830F|nr:interleukin-27 subunit beta isoform X2 [Spea bombifrons]